MLQKGVYPLSDWEKFHEKSLPEKEEFYSNLNLKSITDSDNNLTKKICNHFEIKSFGEYHDFYLKSITLLWANAFQIFRKMSLNIYELVLAKKNFKNHQSKIRVINQY